MAFRSYNDSCYVMWFRKARSFPHLEVSFWCKFWNGDTKVLESTNYKERYLLNALSAKFTTKVVLESAQNITLPREVLHSNNGFCFFCFFLISFRRCIQVEISRTSWSRPTIRKSVAGAARGHWTQPSAKVPSDGSSHSDVWVSASRKMKSRMPQWMIPRWTSVIFVMIFHFWRSLTLETDKVLEKKLLFADPVEK